MSDRKCSECGEPVPPGRRVICGQPLCRQRRLDKQLKALGQRRKHERGGKLAVERTCEYCGQRYAPRAANQRYCVRAECKAAGLRISIKAQAERRQQARQDRRRSHKKGVHP